MQVLVHGSAAMREIGHSLYYRAALMVVVLAGMWYFGPYGALIAGLLFISVMIWRLIRKMRELP